MGISRSDIHVSVIQQAPKISDDKIEKMVKELTYREEKSRSFSRRRKYREEKDVDSINDRNEHFNKKIERAFGKYTLEIKNNLERGTALPDWGKSSLSTSHRTVPCYHLTLLILYDGRSLVLSILGVYSRILIQQFTSMNVK